MKKLILIVGIALLSLSSKAQKLEKIKIDKFTGDTTIETRDDVLSNKMGFVTDYLSCNIVKLNSNYELTLHISKGINLPFSTHPGNQAIFKFKDGSLLKIITSLDKDCEMRYYGSSSRADSRVWYNIKKNDIDKFKNGEVIAIRIETSAGPFDYDISDGKADVIKNQLNLFK